jgi:hypothetical protein
MAMTSSRHQFMDAANLPRNNPCAQCGAPIPLPEWVEQGDGCVAYLWHCHSCDYQFEAIAYFHDSHGGGEGHALAA